MLTSICSLACLCVCSSKFVDGPAALDINLSVGDDETDVAPKVFFLQIDAEGDNEIERGLRPIIPPVPSARCWRRRAVRNIV